MLYLYLGVHPGIVPFWPVTVRKYPSSAGRNRDFELLVLFLLVDLNAFGDARKYAKLICIFYLSGHGKLQVVGTAMEIPQDGRVQSLCNTELCVDCAGSLSTMFTYIFNIIPRRTPAVLLLDNLC
jgi:hypothetical protein